MAAHYLVNPAGYAQALAAPDFVECFADFIVFHRT